MALLATFSGDREFSGHLVRALGHDYTMIETRSWTGFLRLLRERPVTAAVVDHGTLRGLDSGDPLRKIRKLYPHLGLVLIVRRPDDPLALFELGRSGVRHLLLLPVDDLRTQLRPIVDRARSTGAAAQVCRRLSTCVPHRELAAVRSGMEDVHRRLSADQFAVQLGLSRPHLSERLKREGLPSTGHLLVWCRLLHGGHWLVEPGRNAESVSRQLEYSSGAAFRRALKAYTGATPTEVIERGGLPFVLGSFLQSCGLQSGAPPASGVPAA